MSLLITVILILVGVVVLICLLYVGVIIFVHKTLYSYRKVAGGLNISTEWLELSPEPPLKVTKHLQYLLITVDGYDRGHEDVRTQIELPDGTVVNPEVEIVDGDGGVYRLHPSLLLPSGLGFTGTYDPYHSLPRLKTYTKVRIRSDKPFHASRVVWENMNLK